MSQIREGPHRAVETQRATVVIHHLTCAGDAQRLEGALARLPGVVAAYVNAATEMAYVEFRPAEAAVHDLVRVIRQTGFEAGQVGPR